MYWIFCIIKVNRILSKKTIKQKEMLMKIMVNMKNFGISISFSYSSPSKRKKEEISGRIIILPYKCYFFSSKLSKD